MIIENSKVTFPKNMINKIRSDAHSYQTTENYGRSGGYYGDSEDYGRSYKSICIYVQNGLYNQIELFKEISKSIFKIQSNNKRKYPLLVFGFGETEHLQHEKKYFNLGYANSWHNTNKIAETISRISGNKPVKNAIIPELFPKVDIRSLYSGKIKIDRDDLLIIIGKKNEVFFDKKLKMKLNNKIRKHILFVEIYKNNIQWYFRNFNPEYKAMVTINSLEDICKNIGEKLIKMYHQGSSDNLIFPYYRSGKKRVSEQEARFIFALEISKQNSEYNYAVEVPTQLRYSDFSKNPTVYSKKEKGGRSGSIDLSLFNKNDMDIPLVNIEFKKGQPTQTSITKDILKLISEPHEKGIFFHILEHSNEGTLHSLIKKFNKSIELIRQNKDKFHCPIFFLFIVILEKDGRKRRSCYLGGNIDISKKDPIKKENLIEY